MDGMLKEELLVLLIVEVIINKSNIGVALFGGYDKFGAKATVSKTI